MGDSNSLKKLILNILLLKCLLCFTDIGCVAQFYTKCPFEQISRENDIITQEINIFTFCSRKFSKPISLAKNF